MKQIFKKLMGAVLMLLAVQGLQAATPDASLQNLVTKLQALDTELAGIQLSADRVCAPLKQANQGVRDALNAVTAVDGSLSAPLQVDAATYDALDTLILTSLSIANEALRLSVNLQQLQGSTSSLNISDGLTAMLQLSDDIGTMADRIGEMADRILVMADNINTMADRIIQTQEIQSLNMRTTTQTLLQTQTNALTLVSYAETASYSLNYSGLYDNGMALYYRMQSVVLSPWNMKYELQAVAADVRSYLVQLQTFSDTVNADAAAGTFYVDAATLTQLYNLSVMLTFVSTAVDGYVVAIGGLQPITSTPTLSDSMQSMLQLSGDIGTMADRIGEMSDVILSMADNIGMVADGIVATQQLQSTNLATVQSSVLGAQQFVISLMVLRGL